MFTRSGPFRCFILARDTMLATQFSFFSRGIIARFGPLTTGGSASPGAGTLAPATRAPFKVGPTYYHNQRLCLSPSASRPSPRPRPPRSRSSMRPPRLGATPQRSHPAVFRCEERRKRHSSTRVPLHQRLRCDAPSSHRTRVCSVPCNDGRRRARPCGAFCASPSSALGCLANPARPLREMPSAHIRSLPRDSGDLCAFPKVQSPGVERAGADVCPDPPPADLCGKLTARRGDHARAVRSSLRLWPIPPAACGASSDWPLNGARCALPGTFPPALPA